MGYYSTIDDFDGFFNLSDSTLTKSDWEDFEERDMSLPYILAFVTEADSDGKITSIYLDYGDSGKAYEIESELKQLQDFFNEKNVRFEISFTLNGEENADIQRYKIDNEKIVKSEASITFTDWKTV